MISVVVPTLNEEPRLIPLLESLLDMQGEKEIIVSDGGSIDNTTKIAEDMGAAVVHSSPGRARQMNAGAGAAVGDVLWFLHADSVLSDSSLKCIEKTIKSGLYGGFFRLYFYDAKNYFLRFIASTSHTRAQNFGLIFGDQGLFLRRDIFLKFGGFAPLELMEDWEISRRLRPLHRRGYIRALDTPIGTSARRYLKNGIFRTWLKMNIVKGLYLCGVPTEKLRDIYDGRSR